MKKAPVSRWAVLFSLTAIAAAGLTGLAQDKPGGKPEATTAQKSVSQLHSDDRGVKQEQWGWRPFDQSTVQFNPPSFVWPHEDHATKTPCYTLQWAATKDFRDAVTIDKLPLNAYTHHAPLKPGTYYWRYRYTRGSETSEWSYVRIFTLPADAIVFPMPSPEQREQRIPQGHPRLFLRPEDLPRLRKLAAGEGAAAGAFAVVRQKADAALAAPLPEEPLGLKKDWPRRVAALKALVDGEALAFAYLITQDRKYAVTAEKWLLQLASWDSLHGATAFDEETGGDEVSLPMLHRMARIYDWAYDGLSLQARAKVLGVLRVRAADEWKGFQFGSGPGLFNYPYSSHANRAWHKLAETAIATYRELPESEMYLNCALNKFFAAYPVWSDEDGGWHEGLRYWNDYMCKVVWWLQVAQSALQINGFQKPYFAHIGDYPMYIAPPGAANSGFGDMGYAPPRTEYGEYMNYYIREVARAVPGGGHSAYWRWWTEAWKMPPNLPDRDAPDGGILYFLYTANLGPLPAPRAPSDIPQSKVFRGVGVAALHKTLLDANDDVEILFKSSPFGRKSHGHEPQNDFMLNAYGESLLAGNSYRDSHHSKFHVLWVYKSQSHNTVGVNREGQLPPPVRMRLDPPSLGKIIDFALQPRFDYVTGDATEAYGGRLTRAIRTIAFAKPDLVVVCDDLAAAEPSSYQFYLHGLSAFQVDATAQRLSLQQPKAGVEVQYLGPTSLEFTQTDGYTPKPNKIAILGECPNQWHVMASTPHKSPSLVMLTVVVPYKSGAKAHWSAERLESPTAVGVRVRRGDAVTLVAFKKAGIDSNASLDGLSFGQRTALSTQEKE